MSDIDLFDIYKDNASVLVAITTTNPLNGTGSLEISRTAGLRANMMPKVGGKFTSGRARFLLGFGANPIAADLIGFAFNASQRDLTGAAGTAYVVELRVVSGASETSRFHLARYTAGMPTKTDLAEGSTFAHVGFVKPSSIPVEIVWQLDIATLGGIRIVVKHGNVANYNGQTQAQIFVSTVLTTTDIDTVLTTTVLQGLQGEGPVAQVATSGKMCMDSLSVVPYFIGAS